MFLFFLSLLFLPSSFSFSFCLGRSSSFPFCDPSLSLVYRIKDLVNRVQGIDKIAFLSTNFKGIESIGLPAFQFWSEALHGLAKSPGVMFEGKVKNATSFPQIINMGATFDMKLVREMASVISTEARVMNNEGQAGLVFFTPNINLFRDPRWGRGQETPGEDVYLTQTYVKYLLDGLENGDDSRFVKIVANCKHFVAYDMEDSDGTDRFHFDAQVSPQDMAETFLPPFEACVKNARVSAVMCSYNAVNGVPNCANSYLLTDVLRGKYGMNGFVVSDCDAIYDIFFSHHYTNSTEETVQVALRAGCDLDCGDFYAKYAEAALAGGYITSQDLDVAISRTWGSLFRLGLFDPIENQIYTQYGPDFVANCSNTNLALQAAVKSIVLLQNDGTLPFRNSSQIIGLIGPHANSTTALQGNYFGKAPFLISPLEGFAMISEITTLHAKGCDIASNDTSLFDEAVNVALKVDQIVLFFGLDQTQEQESKDRKSTLLPPIQNLLFEFIQESLHAAGKKTPIVLVLLSGSSVDVTAYKPHVNSIVWAGYPGESGGLAIARILFGLDNPSGRLPITFYPESYLSLLRMTDMAMHASSTRPGRTYRFYTGPTVFPFGFGMSYSKFEYQWLANNTFTFPASVWNRSDVGLSLRVINSGPYDGEVVVLLFINKVLSSGEVIKTLSSFQRITIVNGNSVLVFFPVLEFNHGFFAIDSAGQKFVDTNATFSAVINTGDLETAILLTDSL